MLAAPKPPPFGREEAVAQAIPAPRPQGQPQQPRGMVARGQAPGDDAPLPPPTMPSNVALPSREELGLLTAHHAGAAPGLEWSAVRQQLDRWQATHYRLEKTADGGFRFLCTLPYAQNPGKQRQFEANAASEGEAMRLVLDQAEGWLRTQR